MKADAQRGDGTRPGRRPIVHSSVTYQDDGRRHRSVRFPGGNEFTVADMQRFLAEEGVPTDARVRTMPAVGRRGEHEVTFWWHEDGEGQA